MKLKKTRKNRKCYECKSFINKGDLYCIDFIDSLEYEE